MKCSMKKSGMEIVVEANEKRDISVIRSILKSYYPDFVVTMDGTLAIENMSVQEILEKIAQEMSDHDAKIDALELELRTKMHDICGIEFEVTGYCR